MAKKSNAVGKEKLDAARKLTAARNRVLAAIYDLRKEGRRLMKLLDEHIAT